MEVHIRLWTITCVLLIGLATVCVGLVPPIALEDGPSHTRVRREVTIFNRTNCGPGNRGPSNRMDTSIRLAMLRDRLNTYATTAREGRIAAYIIPTDDEHQSEYVAEHDQRRAYISGFTGSAGTAIVTTTKAALWTDGRYFLQAEDQLDCNWILMKMNVPGVPTFAEWLGAELRFGDSVGADPKLVGAQAWIKWAQEFDAYGIKLVPVRTNLVDDIWTGHHRPPLSTTPIYVHELEYAGKEWLEKIKELREELQRSKIDMMVVTALDEVAWLFNLRGNDVSYNPVFRAYAMITPDSIHLYVPLKKVSDIVRNHLRSRHCKAAYCVKLHEYEQIFHELPMEVRNWNRVLIPSRYSYAGGASYAIYELVHNDKRVMSPSPVLFMKGRKNPTEIHGMQSAHIRDSVALCQLLSLLEEQVPKGIHWDELQAAHQMAVFRSRQDLNRGASFETISAFGPNSAIIHYVPTPATNSTIDTSSVYLLDSGGQYLDGTTDVTRTVHYGDPTDFQKEMYTRVLMGLISLATVVFPDGTTDSDVDLLARMPLYEAGLKYRHGSGHGIGSYLNVHEGPIQVTNYGTEAHVLEEGQFLSNEPGYYKDYDFGIRLEDIMRVIRKETPYDRSAIFYGFEPVTLVPFEPKLIMSQLMTQKQRDWLNEYNALVRSKVGAMMKKQDDMKTFHWLMTKTGYVDNGSTASHGVSPTHPVLLAAVLLLCCVGHAVV